MKMKITDGKTEAMAQVENPTGDGCPQFSLSLKQARRLNCSELKDSSGAIYDRRCTDMGRLIFSRNEIKTARERVFLARHAAIGKCCTAGPWVVTDSGKIKAEAMARMGFSDYVCQMPYASKAEAAEMPRAVNDARLIAAAPELLEAVNKALEFIEQRMEAEFHINCSEITDSLYKAIAKAEGK